MGIANVANRAGKRVVKEAGYVAGLTAVQGWASVLKGGVQSIRQNIAVETRSTTTDELKEIKGEFFERLAGLTAAEYTQQARRWQTRSRWHFLGASILLSVSIYFLTIDSGWTGLNTLGLATLNFAQGLRASFRYWQMQTQTFFVEGAFNTWLKQGNWLV